MRKLMALLLALVLLCSSAGFAEALNDAPAAADPATPHHILYPLVVGDATTHYLR